MASRTYNYCFNPDVDDIECFLIQIDCMIKSLNIEDEDGKKRALIESLSTKALKQLLVHLHPTKWDAESTTLEILKEGLRKMYTPQINKWVARELFNHRIQREDENVEEYAVALKDLATYCDFGEDYESRIMEKLSVGLRDAANKQAMFRFYDDSVPNIDITLEKAIEKAIAIESATNITYMFNHPGYDGYDTGTVGIHTWSVAPKIPSNWRCWRCGECDHAAESCWVKTQLCPICREYGHIPQMCSAVQRSYEQGRREHSGDGQPMDNILDFIRSSQSGGPQHFPRRRGGRGRPIASSEPVDETILEFLRSPMQNQRQFQGRGRIPSLPHIQNANDMGYDNMRDSVGRGSMPQPAFGDGKQRQFPQQTQAYDESDIEYDQNSLSPNRGGRQFRGRGGSRLSPARVEEVQTDYLQAAHPAGRNDRLQVTNQLSAGGGGPVRAAVSPAHNTSVGRAPTAVVDNAPTAVESAPQNVTSVNQGPPQATNISKSLNQAPPQLSEKSSKQFMPQEPEVHHTLPKQNIKMNNLLSELQHRHKNWRGSKSQSPSDFGDEGNEKDKFRSLPRNAQRHSWGGSGLPKSGSMTSEGETDESIDQTYASLNNPDGRTNIVALDLHSPAAAAVPTDKALSVSSTPLVKPFKLPPSAYAPFEPVIPAPPTPPPRVRGNKLTSDFKGDKESVVKACSKEESEFVEDKQKSKEDSESVEHSKHNKEDSDSIDLKKYSKEDSESVNTESQSKGKSESVEKKEVKMTAVTNSEEKKPSPKTRSDQPPLPARTPRITVPHMKSPEPNSEIPPSSPSTPPPPPPPPPSDYDCIASPTPPDLPPPPEICRSISPPPPPPPPSYHLSEVPGDELPPPPPPPPTHQQEATLEFPPPPPSIAESKVDHTEASGASLPTPPTPPPRHVKNGTKTEKNDTIIKKIQEELIDKPDLPPPPVRVLRGIDAFFPDDAICNQVIEETEEEDEEFHTDITDTDDEVFHEALSELPEKFINSNRRNLETSDLCSLDSSSTLTATLLLTQASDVSPLPPHALRVSPVPTEEATNLSSPGCTTITDDHTITPVSDFTPVSNLFDMSKESTLDMETPAPTPQLSETPVSTGEYSPDLQKISSPSIEEFDSKIGSDISFSQSPTGTLSSETLSTLTPEISDLDRRSPSLSSANATRAHMSSPRSIDTPTLFSLPTDPSRISVDFDSLVADSLTIDTSTFNTSSQNHFLASCSEFSDSTSRRSIDSALGSAPLSPAYTGSCTITPMPTDTISQVSTNPTTTPIPSPIPTELLTPTPPSSLPSEAFVSPWQSSSNSASIDTSSIQEDITPTDLNPETTNVQNLTQTSQKDEKDSNLSSITESSVKETDIKDIKSSDLKSFSSLTKEGMEIGLYSEGDKYVEDKYNLNVEENEKSNITISLASSLASTTKSFNAEDANGDTELIEKIIKDVIDTGTQLTASLSEVQKEAKGNDINQLNKQEDKKTSCANTSDIQTPSSVKSSSSVTSQSITSPSVTSPEVKSSFISKARSSLTSTSSVESTSSLTSLSSLSNESNTVSSVDTIKLQKKEKTKTDVIVKELGARNTLTDQIVRELGARQKSEDKSNASRSNKPPQPESIASTPFTVNTPPGSPATLRRRGRPIFLPRGSPEPHLEILSIPDPPTPPPRRNKLGSTKATPEASKCDLSIATTTKTGFVPRPPQRANTLPVISLRNSMPGKLPSFSSTSPLPATLPVPISGKHNKSPSSPIPIPGKQEKSPSSSPSIRSLINMGGARMKSLSPLRDRETKHKSPARSSSPIRWVHSPIPSSPQSPIAAAPKSPEQAINHLDNIMDSLDALTANLPNSPPPEPEKSGQFFFPQGPISSNKVKQDTIDDVEIPWRKKRPEAGANTNTDESAKTSASKKGRPNSECLENLVNQILSDVDTNLEMQKTEVSSYQGQTKSKQTESKQTESKQTESKQTESKQTESKQTESKQTESKQTESKQTESFKTKSVTKQISSEARTESFKKEYEEKVNITYSNKNDISFAAQSQQEKLDQIRKKKNPDVKEESKSAVNSCDSTHKETTVTFASNLQESRIHDDATSTPPSVSHRSKTPPLPPPRSTTTTPKPLIGLSHGPIPPVRQYMLVPINHPLAVHSARSTPARQLSPPPAPLRSSSIRKTSPPPPPSRSRSHTPVGRIEWTEQRPPLPPPPLSACTSTTPTPLKLTPVPEESSSRSPSVHSQSSQSADEKITENTISEQTSKDITNKSSVSCGFVGKVSDIVLSKSSGDISSAEPPRVPPPPSDDVDNELPPPPPPPPSDTTPEEKTPPPPPLPFDISILSIQMVPTPPPRANIVTPALPPPPNIPLNSSPFSPQLTPPEVPPPPVVDVEILNNINNFFSAESEPGNSEVSIMPSEPPPPQTLQANETANTSIKVDPEINPTVSQCWKCGVLNPTHNTSNCPGPRICTNKSFLPPELEPPQAPVPPPPPPPPPRPISATGSTESSSPTPPVLSVSPYGRIVVNRTDLPPSAPEEEIRKVFQNAKNWAWIDPFTDTLGVYTQLRPTMQQGPQCGIVALSMATQIFAETMDVDAILKMAKDHGFTAHGEMFSAEKMAELANEISGVEASVHRDVLSNPKLLLETLLQGDFILVPYDADSNHQPSKRKGHRAHWGIVCGALVQCPSLNVSMGGAAKLDPRVDNLYHLRPKNRSGLPSSARRGGGGTTPVSGVSPRFSASPLDAWGTPDLELWSVCSSRVSTPQLQSLPDDDMTMVVLWRQGKSRNLIASTLEELCGSNDQLEEYPPPADEREQDALELLEPGSCCVITIQQQLP